MTEDANAARAVQRLRREYPVAAVQRRVYGALVDEMGRDDLLRVVRKMGDVIDGLQDELRHKTAAQSRALPAGLVG